MARVYMAHLSASFTKSALLAAALTSAFAVSACTSMTGSDVHFGNGESINQARLDSRLEESATVFKKLLMSPDGGVPEELLKKAQCVVVMPGLVKAAFIGGGRFGRGVVTCKDDGGVWSPPAFISLTGGSIGWQIGAESADVVLFVTGRDAQAAMLSATGLTLGADIGVAAGPVGRKADAKTNFSRSGIFSYASTQGLFAGISLEGAVMSPDRDSNRTYYGQTLSTSDIIAENRVSSVPPAAQKLISILPAG